MGVKITAEKYFEHASAMHKEPQKEERKITEQVHKNNSQIHDTCPHIAFCCPVEFIGVGETLVGHPFAMTADLKKILMRLPADSIVSLTHPRSKHSLVSLSLELILISLITNSSQAQVAKLKFALQLCGMQCGHTRQVFLVEGKVVFPP